MITRSIIHDPTGWKARELAFRDAFQEGVAETPRELSIRWLTLSKTCLRDECQAKSGNSKKCRAHQQKTNQRNLTEKIADQATIDLNAMACQSSANQAFA